MGSILSCGLDEVASNVVPGGLQSVVPAAQDLEVVGGRGPLRPGRDVVNVAQLCWCAAAVRSTGAVTEEQGSSESWRWIAPERPKGEDVLTVDCPSVEVPSPRIDWLISRAELKPCELPSLDPKHVPHVWPWDDRPTVAGERGFG